MSQKISRKTLVGALIGNVLEYYDVALYGYLAVMLAPIFFPPTANSWVAVAESFLVFGVSFFVRPLGSLIFGHYGDKLGRKNVLAVTMIMAAVPTFGVGILPSYETIGIMAPIILIIVRIFHGLSVGGECAGVTSFLIEHSSKEQNNFIGSLMPTTASLGAVVGVFLTAFFTMEFMPEWGWRIPFLLGGLTGFFGYYIRMRLTETPEFEKIKSQNLDYPIKSVIVNRWRSMIYVIAVVSATVVPFQISLFYMNQVIINELHFSTSFAMMVGALLTASTVLLMPIVGYYGDRIGTRSLLYYSIFLTSFLSYPLFSQMYDPSIMKVLLLQVLLLTSTVGVQAALPNFMANLFPTKERYSGMAVSHSIAMAIFGGTTLPVCTTLVGMTGIKTIPAIYIICVGIFALIAIRFTRSQSTVSGGSLLPANPRLN